MCDGSTSSAGVMGTAEMENSSSTSSFVAANNANVRKCEFSSLKSGKRGE